MVAPLKVTGVIGAKLITIDFGALLPHDAVLLTTDNVPEVNEPSNVTGNVNPEVVTEE